MAPRFAVEESDYNIAGYKRIHLEGCRDLIDPEPAGEANTWEELLNITNPLVYWDEMGDSHDAQMADLKNCSAPCTHKALKK